MTNIETKEKRSQIMAAVKNKNTKPEVYLRRLLFRHGYRYRLYSKAIPGHPDLWLKKYNTVIFVNGCFWHMHSNCKRNRIPKSNEEYWRPKLLRNVQRDTDNKRQLYEKGYRCLVIWECSLDHLKKNESELFDLIEAFFKSDDMYKEI